MSSIRLPRVHRRGWFFVSTAALIVSTAPITSRATAVAVGTRQSTSAATSTQDSDERILRYRQLRDFDSYVDTPSDAHWTTHEHFWFTQGPASAYSVDARTGRRVSIPKSEIPADQPDPRRRPQIVHRAYPTLFRDTMEVPSPDGQRFLGIRDGNLSIRTVNDSQSDLLTTSGGEAVVWKVESAAWSPDTHFVAAISEDYRGVDRVPIVHWLGRETSTESFLYTLTGGRWNQPTLHLIDLSCKCDAAISLATEDHYLTILGFSADSKAVRVAVMSRDYKQLSVVEVDAVSHHPTTLMTERTATFLFWPDVFFGHQFVTFLADGRFILLSERSGWKHLYLYSARGKPIRALSAGQFPVVDLLGVDEKRGVAFFSAHPDPLRPYDTHIMRTDLATGRFVQLTSEPGEHVASLSPGYEWFIDKYSAQDIPVRMLLRNTRNGNSVTIAEADTTKLQSLGWKPPEPFVTKAADGTTDIYGLIYKPRDFDEKKRYPVVELVYGMGFVTVTPRSFGPSGLFKDSVNFLQALTELGFIGIVMDGRGTPGRSKQFQDVTYLNLGQYEIADHAGALKQLARIRPYMDMSRVGIFGNSYGGYLSLRALLQAPEVYSTAVASSPVEFSENCWAPPAEVYLGLWPENRTAYDRAANIPLLANLQSENLLLLAGTNDVNTPMTYLMRLTDNLVKQNKDFSMILVPEVNHLFMRADSHATIEYWYEAIRRHFIKTLHPL